MRADLTDIVVILDRSGSMASVKTDMEGGLNSLIEDQKTKPGDAVFTLIQFDTEYEVVHNAKPLKEVTKCFLNPRGRTALLDAVGKGITVTGERLAAMKEEDRPGLVIFVIITDGAENASREFKLDAVRKMIKEQSEVYKWQFVFLGANDSAFAGGAQMGMPLRTSMKYDGEVKTSGMMELVSKKMGDARMCSIQGKNVDMSYTDEERAELA